LPTPLSFCCCFVASFVAWLVVGASTHDLGVHVQVVGHGTFKPTNSIFWWGFFYFLFLFISKLGFFFKVCNYSIKCLNLVCLCRKNFAYCTTLVQLIILFLNTITKIEHLLFSKQFLFCMMLKAKNELKFVLNC
jgi:hypothetical protein